MSDNPRDCSCSGKGSRVRTSKGKKRADWCGDCGGLISGRPSLTQKIHRLRHNKWKHQNKS